MGDLKERRLDRDVNARKVKGAEDVLAADRRRAGGAVVVAGDDEEGDARGAHPRHAPRPFPLDKRFGAEMVVDVAGDDDEVDPFFQADREGDVERGQEFSQPDGAAFPPPLVAEAPRWRSATWRSLRSMGILFLYLPG